MHRLVEGRPLPRQLDGFGSGEAVNRAQTLPLDGQKAMPLQVAKCPVVSQDVESVGGSLEGSTRPVTSVVAAADIGPHHVHAILHRHRPHPGLDDRLGLMTVRIEHARDELGLGVGIPIDEVDYWRVEWRFGHRKQLRGERVDRVAGVGEICTVRDASVVEVDALQEGGDHLAQFGEHEIGIRPSFGQRVGPHAQQQRLVALTGAVDAHIGQ